MWWWTIIFAALVVLIMAIGSFIEDRWDSWQEFKDDWQEEKELRMYRKHAGKAYFDAYSIRKWNESPMSHLKHKKAHRAGTR